MYEYDVSKSNMWREVHEQPEIIRHVIDVNLPIIENICKEVDNRNISKVLLVGRGSSEHALLVGKYAFEVYTVLLSLISFRKIIRSSLLKLSVSASTFVNPTIALSGVRISCVILAIKAFFN